jgi:hypothetical protein
MLTTMPNQSVNIYQIFHKPELVNQLDPAFVPFDHCEFTAKNPDESNRWREWLILNDIGYKRAQQDQADVWGFVSYKWQEKTQISGQKFVDFIRNNPDNEVWFMEPHYKPFNPFMNTWVQGDMFHPSISKIPNSFMTLYGHKLDVKKMTLPLCYYNFFAATKKFWDVFLETMNTIIDLSKQSTDLHNALFNFGAGHGNDPTIPHWIFVVERMFPVIMALSGMNHIGLKYHTNDFLVDPKNLVEVVEKLYTINQP